MMRFFTILLLAAASAACGPDPEALLERAARYWDGEDFADPAFAERAERTEARFADYLSLLQADGIKREQAGRLLADLLRSTEAGEEACYLFRELAEKYLYSPESPVRDEELYIHALRQQIESRHFDDYHKLRPRYQLNMALRNRPGDVATDFAYTLPNGDVSTLHELEADFTILFFHTPGCEACAQATAQLQRRPLIRLLEKWGSVRVLRVYSDPGEDIEGWKGHLGKNPPRWIEAYDEGARLHYDGLYDLRSTPCIYLLDADKRVLCKGVNSAAAVAKALRKALF